MGKGKMTEIFDRQALLERVEGDEELLEELVHIFLDHTPRQLDKLRQALEVGDASALREQAHTIKGAAASISAASLMAAAQQVESAGKNRELKGAGALVENLAQEFERLKEVVGG